MKWLTASLALTAMTLAAPASATRLPCVASNEELTLATAVIAIPSGDTTAFDAVAFDLLEQSGFAHVARESSYDAGGRLVDEGVSAGDDGTTFIVSIAWEPGSSDAVATLERYCSVAVAGPWRAPWDRLLASVGEAGYTLTGG